MPDSNKDEKYWRRREKNNLVIFCSTGAGNCDFFWNCVVQSIKSHRFKCPPVLGFYNLLCQPISPSLWHSFLTVCFKRLKRVKLFDQMKKMHNIHLINARLFLQFDHSLLKDFVMDGNECLVFVTRLPSVRGRPGSRRRARPPSARPSWRTSTNG